MIYLYYRVIQLDTTLMNRFGNKRVAFLRRERQCTMEFMITLVITCGRVRRQQLTLFLTV